MLVDITWNHFVKSSISNQDRHWQCMSIFFGSFCSFPLARFSHSGRKRWDTSMTKNNFSLQEPLSVSMWALKSQELQFITLIVSLPVEVSHGRMAYFKIENMTACVKSVLPFCLQSSHCGNLFSAGITAEIQRAMRFFFKKWKRSQVQSERCWSRRTIWKWWAPNFWL